MKKEENNFIVEVKNNIVNKVHNSFVYQPKICFVGGEVKWYEDKQKETQN